MIRRDEQKVFEEEVAAMARFLTEHAYAHQVANNLNRFTCSAQCVAQSIMLLGLREHDKRVRGEAWDDGYIAAVRDHMAREDDAAFCRWPTSPNPYWKQPQT